MWDFSKKENVDMYSDKGFHYELHVTTGEQVGNRWKGKSLTWDELLDSDIDLITLVPEAGHNWSRVMGNLYSKNTGKEGER